MGNYKFCEWDDVNFVIPKEYELTEDNELADALNVFFTAGGYEFFNVVEPDSYSDKWLEYIGNLYSDIVDVIYFAKGKKYQIPLSDAQKRELLFRGVPQVFLTDL